MMGWGNLKFFSSVVAALTNRPTYTYLYACRQRLIIWGGGGGWKGGDGAFRSPHLSKTEPHTYIQVQGDNEINDFMKFFNFFYFRVIFQNLLSGPPDMYTFLMRKRYITHKMGFFIPFLPMYIPRLFPLLIFFFFINIITRFTPALQNQNPSSFCTFISRTMSQIQLLASSSSSSSSLVLIPCTELVVI